MKQQRILDMLEHIDEKYIIEAAQAKPKEGLMTMADWLATDEYKASAEFYALVCEYAGTPPENSSYVKGTMLFSYKNSFAVADETILSIRDQIMEQYPDLVYPINNTSVIGNEIIPDGDMSYGGGARIFNANPIAMPGGEGRIIDAARAGDRLFICSEENNKSCFYFMGADLNVTKADIALDSAVVSIDADSDENIYVLSMEQDGSYIITKLNPALVVSGTLIFPADMEEALWDMTVGPEGYYIETFNNVLCYDLSGKYTGELGPFQDAFDVIKNDTELILAVSGDDYTQFSILSGFETGDTYKVSMALSGISAGPRAGHVFAVNSGIVWDLDFTSGNYTGYSNSYASGEVGSFMYLSPDAYLSVVNGELMYYTLARQGEGSEIQTLVLATYAREDYEISDLLNSVNLFNEANGDIKIDVVNYGIYDAGNAEGAGLQKLYNDISAGNAPDIYDLSLLPYRTFYDKALLENLYPYFESSGNIRAEDLTASVLKAMEYKGALYNLVPTYTIITMYGPGDVCDRENWNAGAFLQVADTADLSLFGPQVTRYEFLKYLLMFSGDEYINEEERSCSFTDSTFPAMLSVARSLPESYDGANAASDDLGLVYTGRQMFILSTNANIVSSVHTADAVYGGNCVHLGFPSDNNGVMVNPYINLGMSANSAAKEGVWRFFEYLLSDEYQNGIRKTIPVKNTALDARLDSLLSKYLEVHNVVVFADNNMIKVPLAPISEDVKTKAMDIIDSVDCVYYCNDGLYDLLVREAEPYFSGDLSVEKAAENIQSKVSIYLAEQYG